MNGIYPDITPEPPAQCGESVRPQFAKYRAVLFAHQPRGEKRRAGVEFRASVGVEGTEDVQPGLEQIARRRGGLGKDGMIGKPADAVMIASFNIQVFGESKLAKPQVVDTKAAA